MSGDVADHRDDHPVPARGRLIVLTGPSGVGKDTVLHALFALDPRLSYCVSYTTRSPRPGERNGVDYWFVSEDEFRAMIERDEFFEWSPVYAELKGRTFASVDEAVRSGRDTVIKIDVQGAAKVRSRMGDDALYIFLMPPSMDELRERLRRRATETDAQLRTREESSVAEMAAGDSYDHRVVNDNAERAALEILELIDADRRRRVVARG